MKTLRTCVIAALLGAFAPGAGAADWYAAQDPFAVYGNTYYVGTGAISAVLITSTAGHILIDGGPPGAGARIAAHIRTLGFRVEDIRYILDSHEHHDHAGGIAELQALSGATVLGSPRAVDVLRSGRPDEADPQYPNLKPMQPVANTHAVHDGETVRLGPLSVTAHFTPGHSRGATSWTWQSTESGRTVNIVYADSLNALAVQGRRFGANPRYPEAKADLERSIATVDALPCDVLLSAHPEVGGLWERKARQTQIGNAAFIDREACHGYASRARAILAQTLAKEAS